MKTTKCMRLILAAGAIMSVLPWVVAQAAPVTGLRVYFALDKQLTRPLFMGERLVAPSTFYAAIKQGTVITVEVEVHTLTAQGWNQVQPATFTPANPTAVTVAPGKKKRVLITANGCGLQTSLTVTSSGGSKQLSLKTICDGQTIRAVISQ